MAKSSGWFRLISLNQALLIQIYKISGVYEYACKMWNNWMQRLVCWYYGITYGRRMLSYHSNNNWLKIWSQKPCPQSVGIVRAGMWRFLQTLTWVSSFLPAIVDYDKWLMKLKRYRTTSCHSIEYGLLLKFIPLTNRRSALCIHCLLN